MVSPVCILVESFQKIGNELTSASVIFPSLLTVFPLRIDKSTGSRVSVSVSGLRKSARSTGKLGMQCLLTLGSTSVNSSDASSPFGTLSLTSSVASSLVSSFACVASFAADTDGAASSEPTSDPSRVVLPFVRVLSDGVRVCQGVSKQSPTVHFMKTYISFWSRSR